MYKNASQYINSSAPLLMESYRYTPPRTTPDLPVQPVKTAAVPTIPNLPMKTVAAPETSVSLESIKWVNSNGKMNLGNPEIWGPAFWFSLHTSAVFYPKNPSPIVRERMKGRILAIPFEIPCAACKPHAMAFIEQNRNKLDSIVSSQNNLFNFYVDFHNKVNERYGKKTWTYEEAKKYYSPTNDIKIMKY